MRRIDDTGNAFNDIHIIFWFPVFKCQYIAEAGSSTPLYANTQKLVMVKIFFRHQSLEFNDGIGCKNNRG